MQPSTPAAASAGELAGVAGHDAAPEADVDAAAAPRAARSFASSAARVVVTGMQLSGMSTSVVTPPAAAARVAVAKPSHSVRPGSLTCTWVSTRPGAITSVADVVDGTPEARASSRATHRLDDAAAVDDARWPARIAVAARPTRWLRSPRRRATHHVRTPPRRSCAGSRSARSRSSTKNERVMPADEARDRVLHARDAGAAEAEAQEAAERVVVEVREVRRAARRALGELEARARGTDGAADPRARSLGGRRVAIGPARDVRLDARAARGAVPDR